MNKIIADLISEGDFYYSQAKSKFFLKKELKCVAPCINYKALKIYMDTYERFLYNGKEPSNNYHVLMHMIIAKDENFVQFKEKIYNVKCFSEESTHGGEEFYLYSNEIDSVLKIVRNIRNYIVGQMESNDLLNRKVVVENFMAI